MTMVSIEVPIKMNLSMLVIICYSGTGLLSPVEPETLRPPSPRQYGAAGCVSAWAVLDITATVVDLQHKELDVLGRYS